MDIQRVITQRQSLVVGAAAVVPLMACGVLTTLRSSVPNASAALLLVVVVVAAAATGIRAAGLVAALSSALWFDVFLTQPRGQLAITDPADLQATILLITVGLAVSELALWGRRQQARASRTTGYLAGLVDTATTATVPSADLLELTDRVCRQLTDVLGLDGCRFVTSASAPLAEPQLTVEGIVVRRGRVIDVTRDGFPVDDETVLPVRTNGRVVGEFLLTAATRVVRPTTDQLRVAVLLADQVGSALTRA
jgi:K+-sensing histidine kinase KdpD